MLQRINAEVRGRNHRKKVRWDDVLEFAFAEAGLMPDVFWDLSWREFEYVVRHKSSEVHREWDIARTLGVWIVSPHSKKKVKPADLLKLPTDKRAKPSTLQEFHKAITAHGKSPFTG